MGRIKDLRRGTAQDLRLQDQVPGKSLDDLLKAPTGESISRLVHAPQLSIYVLLSQSMCAMLLSCFTPSSAKVTTM